MNDFDAVEPAGVTIPWTQRNLKFRAMIHRHRSSSKAFEYMGRAAISAAMATQALSTAFTNAANIRRKKKVRGYKRREKCQTK